MRFQPQEKVRMFALFQLIAVVAVGAYLCSRATELRSRNAQSWDVLVARLRPDWNVRELIDGSFSKQYCRATPQEKWRRIHGASGLWTIYENARVMLELADYAARNSDSFDQDLLVTLRSEAMQVRVLVLTAFGRSALSAASETVTMSVLRVESAYAEMAMRITETLEVHAPEALPGFVAAM